MVPATTRLATATLPDAVACRGKWVWVSPGLFNALVLDWMSPKCHTLMKPPSGSGVGDSRDALPCDSFAGNLHSRAWGCLGTVQFIC